MFAIFVSVFGAVTFSYCMANMTAMITQSTGADSKFDDLLLSITEYLEFRKIPSKLKLKVFLPTCLLALRPAAWSLIPMLPLQVKRHVHTCMRRSSWLYDEEAALSHLPVGLRREILSALQVCRACNSSPARAACACGLGLRPYLTRSATCGVGGVSPCPWRFSPGSHFSPFAPPPCPCAG